LRRFVLSRDLGSEGSISKSAYLFGVLTIFVCVYSQYFILGLDEISGILLVYGIPILVTGFIWGRTIISKAVNQLYTALKFGLGYFGAFTVVAILVSTVILLVILIADPNSLNLLNTPNPVLPTSPKMAWLMVGLSFFVIGPAEEYLFRGFIYGGLLDIFRARHWLFLAFISSILFAGVHLYYALVYGITSLVMFADLIAFGMAMAATYYVSGGNLLIPAMIHGAYDASGFVGVATTIEASIILRGILTVIGIIVAFAIFIQRDRTRRRKQTP
jgi:membrane protease YdiL (CAAX protease family)